MNRIASLRRTAKLTQKQLAETMRVTPETVSRWERSVVKIPDEQKLALATLFGCSVGWLMGWDDPEGNGDNGETEAA